jgi:hypothetical protein
MLAVAVQLPAGVLIDERSGDTCRAPSRSAVEPEPEAIAGVASESYAQATDPHDLMLMTKPPLA